MPAGARLHFSSSMARTRLDLAVADRGLAESREKAQALILAGRVRIDGEPARKAGQLVRPESVVTVDQPEPYVSRGGYKLAHALDRFGIDPAGLVAVDVGASTGGFSDVLLQRGAARVYAVDVGRGQLHWRLRNDPRVVALEGVNVRYLESLPERPHLATVDVSFISLRLVLTPLKHLLESDSSIIALVKPQFEAGRAEVGRGGVVRSAVVHRAVLDRLARWLPEGGLHLRGLEASPIRGPAGNAEFLAWLVPRLTVHADRSELIERAVRQVHPASSDEARPE